MRISLMMIEKSRHAFDLKEQFGLNKNFLYEFQIAVITNYE